MKCLFVKAPWAGWIVDGVKLIEYRTRWTYTRGRIGIIESGSGTVIGDVYISGCAWHPAYNLYEWHLQDGRRYATPVPFEHKQGYVTWALLEYDPNAQEIASALPQDVFLNEYHQYRETIDKWLLEREHSLINGRAE